MSSLHDRYGAVGLETGAGEHRRHTLKATISCVGHGLHSGAPARLALVPAAPGSGIVFHRTDLGVKIPASFDHVIDTRLCTVVGLADDPAARVGTVEHLMAALSAAAIDDLVVEIDGPEVPIFDGSAAPFLFLIECAGVAAHGARRARIEVVRTVSVVHGSGAAELRPHDGEGLSLSLEIDFAAAAIGAQFLTFDLDADGFADELAGARTFTMLQDVEAMRDAGLAQGGSLANAIVVDGAKVLNPEGLRWRDEFVRHKLLDVIGDLALAGAPIVGQFVGRCTGHGLNNRLLHALFADRAHYRITTKNFVTAPPLQAVA